MAIRSFDEPAPGSAWDIWMKAGEAAARDHVRPLCDAEIREEAAAYALTRGFRIAAQAWLEGYRRGKK